MTELQVVLDENVADSLASLICGDDGFRYRSGAEIEALFRKAGWKLRFGLDGGRFAWTRDRIREARTKPEIMRPLLLRLADRREYIDEPDLHDAVLAELNRLLAFENLTIAFEGTRPILAELGTPGSDRMTSEIPVELTANLADIVGDEAFADQLRGRLEQAHACWLNGAPTAAVIMLGSLLEGVLYDYLLHHPIPGTRPTDRFEALIDLAREQTWISSDVADYAHVLRNHRNIVHPRRQLRDDYRPGPDTVRIAWNVVVAALNDLAAVSSRAVTA
ncbi:hypothetical protein ABZS29_32695 [Kribbella sp. NPDC005582]|uniref:hypothetical protein n=1 Tax=Kribbella sp. NPDC005582 TaxID=3156893 RepID=UPI0033B12700